MSSWNLLISHECLRIFNYFSAIIKMNRYDVYMWKFDSLKYILYSCVPMCRLKSDHVVSQNTPNFGVCIGRFSGISSM